MPDALLWKSVRHQLILLKMNLLFEDHGARLKNKEGSLRYLNWLLVFLLVLLLPPARVNAQNDLRISFSPVESTVPIGGTETIKIAVENGTNVNAYDLTVLYDSDKVSLASWSHGAYLSNLAVVFYENEPGRLHIAATQLATPGVSGDGILLNLVFSGTNEGASVLALADVEFYDPDGNGVTPEVAEGYLNVMRAAPSLTPTYTVTPNLSPTPTRSHTATKTATPTPFQTSTGAPSQTPFQFTATIISGQVVTLTPGNPISDPASTSPVITDAPAPRVTTTLQAGNTKPGDAVGQENDRGDALEKDGTLKWVNTILWVFAFLLVSAMIAFIYLIFIRKKNES